ncbi:MAG: DVU0772 family protein [Thermodesulfobacteriota bacterium]
MNGLTEIRNDMELLNNINWEMTPEEAVTLYLEWGNNWARSNYVIRSKNDVAYYFAVNTWEEKPVIYLIRRNSAEAVELARISMPPEMERNFLESVGYNKGVYAVEGEVKTWLQDQLGNN